WGCEGWGGMRAVAPRDGRSEADSGLSAGGRDDQQGEQEEPERGQRLHPGDRDEGVHTVGTTSEHDRAKQRSAGEGSELDRRESGPAKWSTQEARDEIVADARDEETGPAEQVEFGVDYPQACPERRIDGEGGAESDADQQDEPSTGDGRSRRTRQRDHHRRARR